MRMHRDHGLRGKAALAGAPQDCRHAGTEHPAVCASFDGATSAERDDRCPRGAGARDDTNAGDANAAVRCAACTARGALDQAGQKPGFATPKTKPNCTCFSLSDRRSAGPVAILTPVDEDSLMTSNHRDRTHEPPASKRMRATFCFIDLEGFTAHTEAYGDEKAADLATRFAELTRSALGPGDRLVKTIADAVLVTSPNTASAIAMVERLLAFTTKEPDFPAL